jgi:uncharacterized protein
MIRRPDKIPDKNLDDEDDSGVSLFDSQDNHDDNDHDMNHDTVSKHTSHGKFILIIIIASILIAGSLFSSMRRASSDNASVISSSSSSDVSRKHYDASTPFVEDNAKVLSRETDESISNLNNSLKKVDGSPEILVVTVKTLNGADISTFAADKGNQYGIGSKDKNNGLVYVLDVDEHKDFLATGYGMEDKITDVIATNLLDDDSIHGDYKSKDYDSGVQKVLSKVSPYLHGKYSVKDLKRQQNTINNKNNEKINVGSMALPDLIMLIIGLIAIVVAVISTVIGMARIFFSGGSGISSGGGDGVGDDYDSSDDGWSGSGGDDSFGGGGGGSSW